MRVLYDVSILSYGYEKKKYQTGIFRVVDNVARGLATSDECHTEFCASYSQALVQAYIDSETALCHVPVNYSRLKSNLVTRYEHVAAAVETGAAGRKAHLRLWRKGLYLANQVAKSSTHPFDKRVLARADIFHGTSFSIPAQVREIKHIRRFHTFYDLVPVLFPEITINRGVVDSMAETLRQVKADDWAVAISEATKNDLCSHSAMQPDRVFVTPLAADRDLFFHCADSGRTASVRHKYGIPDGPYILSLCTLEARKNIDHLIRSFVRLVQEQNLPELTLVLAGSKGWSDERIAAEIEGAAGLKGRIVLPGFVDNADLAPLYSGALAFVYPSLYEGFGLPPLEAMQCGTPVITSNTSSLPEVVGDAGIMLDPHDADGLCQSMLDLYNDTTLQQSLSEKSLARAAKFSWEHCVHETIQAYKAAVSA